MEASDATSQIDRASTLEPASMRPRRGSLGCRHQGLRGWGRITRFNEAEAWKPRMPLSYIRLISRAIAPFFREVLFHSDCLPFWPSCRSIHYVKKHIYFNSLYGFRAGAESRTLSKVSKRLGNERNIISRWPVVLSLKNSCRCSPLPE